MAVVVSVVLCGCTTLTEMTAGDNQTTSGSSMYQQGTMQSEAASGRSLELADYVKEMIADMALNMRNVDENAKVAVTSFVRSSSDYTQTEPLSLELADVFISELHKFGFTAIDFKVTSYIRVSPDGDFVLTRDYLELSDTVDADYVLVGTYNQHKNNIVVHARIVDLESQTVLATGDTRLPRQFASGLAHHYLSGGGTL